MLQVPPPVVYAACFSAGWLLDLAVARSPAWTGHPWVRPAAWLLLLAAVGVAFWSAAHFLWHRTTVIPHGHPTHLITGGPFAISRNPLYVAMTAAYVAATVLIAGIGPLLLLPAPILFLQRVVIPFEEQQLLNAFGGRYRQYCGRVRRWL